MDGLEEGKEQRGYERANPGEDQEMILCLLFL